MELNCLNQLQVREGVEALPMGRYQGISGTCWKSPDQRDVEVMCCFYLFSKWALKPFFFCFFLQALFNQSHTYSYKCLLLYLSALSTIYARTDIVISGADDWRSQGVNHWPSNWWPPALPPVPQPHWKAFILLILIVVSDTHLKSLIFRYTLYTCVQK